MTAYPAPYPVPAQSRAGSPGGAVAYTRQNGVALAIVVWFIAGMSLLVAGIVSHARVDSQMAQLHVARAKVAAAGDGAIQLMLADLAVGQVAASAVTAGVYQVGALEVEVGVVPTSGLIDLNAASAQILAALFVVAAQLDATEAQTVADNVIKWRSSGAESGQRAKFAAIEDLLRVDGVSRTLLDAIRDYAVVGAPSSAGGTNWSLAPEMVLAVMQKTNPQKAESALRYRANLSSGAAESNGRVGSERQAQAVGGFYRLDAVVRYGDKAWLRRRWVSMGVVTSSLLPWRMVRTEAPRVMNARIENG